MIKTSREKKIEEIAHIYKVVKHVLMKLTMNLISFSLIYSVLEFYTPVTSTLWYFQNGQGDTIFHISLKHFCIQQIKILFATPSSCNRSLSPKHLS